jgi:hypothetical protein
MKTLNNIMIERGLSMLTGDLLLCSGNGAMSRRIAKTQELFAKVQGRPELIDSGATQMTHVAGIVFDNLVFESTTLNTWCGKKGVQINQFRPWLRNYDGKVWVRRVRHMVFSQSERLTYEAAKLTGTPYESGIPGALELLYSGIPNSWLARRLEQTTKLHCSESWAIALHNAALIPGHDVANKLPPMEWLNGHGKFDKSNAGFYGPAEQLK